MLITHLRYLTRDITKRSGRSDSCPREQLGIPEAAQLSRGPHGHCQAWIQRRNLLLDPRKGASQSGCDARRALEERHEVRYTEPAALSTPSTTNSAASSGRRDVLGWRYLRVVGRKKVPFDPKITCIRPRTRAHACTPSAAPPAATVPAHGSRTHAGVEKTRAEPPAVCTLTSGVCGVCSAAPVRPRAGLAAYEVLIVTEALPGDRYKEACTRQQVICGSMCEGASAHLAGVRLEESVQLSYCASAGVLVLRNSPGWTAWTALPPMSGVTRKCARSVLYARGLGAWPRTIAQNDGLKQSFRMVYRFMGRR